MSSTSLGTLCTLTIDVKALLYPFMSSKLGVTSCAISMHEDEIDVFSDDMKSNFEALWSALDGRMAQSITVAYLGSKQGGVHGERDLYLFWGSAFGRRKKCFSPPLGVLLVDGFFLLYWL